MNLYVIGYLRTTEDSDFPERYDVFVIATSLNDALDNAELYAQKDTDIIHSVMSQSSPPMSNLRFTSAVRSKIGER